MNQNKQLIFKTEVSNSRNVEIEQSCILSEINPIEIQDESSEFPTYNNKSTPLNIHQRRVTSVVSPTLSSSSNQDGGASGTPSVKWRKNTKKFVNSGYMWSRSM